MGHSVDDLPHHVPPLQPMSASAPRWKGALPHSSPYHWPLFFTASLSPEKAVNYEQSDLLDMDSFSFRKGMSDFSRSAGFKL